MSQRNLQDRSFPLAAIALCATLALTTPSQAARPSNLAAQVRVAAAYGKLPLRFEANHGQTDEGVKFIARGAGYRLFFASNEAVLSMSPSPREGSSPSFDVVRIRLAGVNQQTRVSGLQPQPGMSNYFMGSNPAQWHVRVPTFGSVQYASVYPGIDLVYYGNQGQLEYDFVVAPGADPRRIELVFDGVRTSVLDRNGNLVLGTRHGDIVQLKPRVSQNIGGKRQEVEGRYVLLAKGHVRFEIGRYDTSETLRIDPVFTYATYLGGSFNDYGRAIAVDSAGNAYVTGETDSLNFPVLGAIQASQAGSHDVYVTKLNASGALVYSTFLGGTLGDVSYAIAVDAVGQAYVTGDTTSGGVTVGTAPYPTVNAFQPIYSGGGDAFVTKLNAAGDAIVYSTFLGGTGGERGTGIAVDSAGSAYVTGNTNSVIGNCTVKCFPVASPFQADNAGPGTYDNFVAKISSTGALIYSTFLGGKNSEYSIEGGGIAVGSDGSAYVTGNTASTDFPGAATSLIQPTNGGGNNDAYIVKFNPAGSALVYSTYLGGNGYDAGHGIAVDGFGNAYVAGYTDSTNFHTAAPLQPAKGAAIGNDAFVAKINAAGTALVYSTYLGGSGGEMAYAVALDGIGNAYVSGFTDSSNFPTVTPLQPANAGTGDAFISVFNATGSSLLYSSYLGGSNGIEHGYGIAVDGPGNMYVVGDTVSTNFPTTVGAFQTAYGGGGADAFVVKLTALSFNGAPASGVNAASVSTTQVAVSWNVVPGATAYQVYRRAAGGGYILLNSPANPPYADAAVTGGNSYLYLIRATNGSAFSPDSAPDIATTILFTNDALVAGSTLIRAVHLVELRNATNAVRLLGNQVAFSFATGGAAGTAVAAAQINEVRGALDAGLSALALPSGGYTDTLAAGVPIKAVHFQEIRNRVK